MERGASSPLVKQATAAKSILFSQISDVTALLIAATIPEGPSSAYPHLFIPLIESSSSADDEKYEEQTAHMRREAVASIRRCQTSSTSLFPSVSLLILDPSPPQPSLGPPPSPPSPPTSPSSLSGIEAVKSRSGGSYCFFSPFSTCCADFALLYSFSNGEPELVLRFRPEGDVNWINVLSWSEWTVAAVGSSPFFLPLFSRASLMLLCRRQRLHRFRHPCHRRLRRSRMERRDLAVTFRWRTER